jgi:hypothetical protein
MSHETLLMNSLKRDAAPGTGGGAAGGIVPVLVRALSGQKAAYSQILSLARQQSAHVAAGESEALMVIFSARNRLIHDIAAFDRDLQPYKGRWQEVLDGLPTADRRVVGELLQEVQRLLAEILERDERDKESLQRQKAVVGGEIQRAVTGAALNKAYRMGGRP